MDITSCSSSGVNRGGSWDLAASKRASFRTGFAAALSLFLILLLSVLGMGPLYTLEEYGETDGFLKKTAFLGCLPIDRDNNAGFERV